MTKLELKETIERFINQTNKSRKLMFDLASMNKSMGAYETAKYLRREWLEAEA